MLINRADSHTSGARCVRQPAHKPESFPEKTALSSRPNFTPDFIFYQNQNYDLPKRLLKKTNFTLNQNNCWNEKIFYADQNACEKRRFVFLPKPLPRKGKPILKTYDNQPWIKLKPRNKANQNHCEPKRKPKTLKPILATRQNQPELMPTKKT